MKKNLFISTGYFATFSSSIIIDFQKSQKQRDKKNYLLIIISKEFSSDYDFKQEVKNQISFAKNVGKWHKIDVVKEQDFSLSVYDNKNYDKKLVDTLFNGDLSRYSFFEVYISSLNILNKLSINFTKANIVDEGVGSHLQILSSDDLTNFSKFYKIIPINSVGNITNINLPKSLLYKKLNKLNNIYKTPKITKQTSVVAVSSFYFIKNEKLKLINIYKDYINRLSSTKQNVTIKLHPRNNKEDFINFKNNLLDANIPLLDMYIVKNRKYIKEVLSMNSSILFMAKYIYNIPAVFIEQKIEDEYTKNINNFYIKHINQ